mgnify:CR=1 FL=1
MADEKPRDPASGVETTGHEWDGVKELDRPLPRWWLIIFYATVVAAIVYWVLMPAWPIGNGYTKGVLAKYAKLAQGAEKGAITSA